MRLDELNRKIQYDVLPEIPGVDEASDVDLLAGYQARASTFPDVDCIIDRSPDTDVFDNAEFAIEYQVTYDNQGVEFTVYVREDDLGIDIEGNGKSEEFLSDFREALDDDLGLEEAYISAGKSIAD